MSYDNERYTSEDLIEEYGKAKAEDYMRRVQTYYDKKGVLLANPASMARAWLRRENYKKEASTTNNGKLVFETRARKHISSMLFAMGRMEHDEMKRLPHDLFHGLAEIKGETAVIDWPVDGLTDEIIARVENCIGLKLIFTADQGDLPF